MRPKLEDLEPTLQKAIQVLEQEDRSIRPEGTSGDPGGLIQLNPDLPSVVIPDVHARTELFDKVLSFHFNGKTIEDHLKADQIQLICLGDVFHTEIKTAERWRKAFYEFKGNFSSVTSMDEEMTQNFECMMRIMRLKIDYPEFFHLLKGNHENILNEDEDGNHSFGKIVMEGMMTKRYFEEFYGMNFLYSWARFEKLLPILTIGNGLVCSHAQPKKHFDREKLIQYRNYPEVIEGLTWTSNHQAEPGSLFSFLNELTLNNPESVWLTGHRPVKGKYKLLEEGKLIQIHNPARYIMAIHLPDRKFFPDQMVIDLSVSKEISFEAV
jgi:hypothetical protein